MAIKLLRNIINKPNRLKKDPFIGQKEDLLKDRKILYRYLIFRNFKIIYTVDQLNGLIKIADVFDTRQNPIKIEQGKKLKKSR